MNELINELYAKIDNQEKIIRELQEKIILLKNAEPMLELTKEYGEKNLYKQRIDKAIKIIKEYYETSYISNIKAETVMRDIREVLGSDE